MDKEELIKLTSKINIHSCPNIVNFHCLFWPAMLRQAGFRTPSGVNVHGFVTIDGLKMSKSRGTFIQARTYLNHLDPEYLRYYFGFNL